MNANKVNMLSLWFSKKMRYSGDKQLQSAKTLKKSRVSLNITSNVENK